MEECIIDGGETDACMHRIVDLLGEIFEIQRFAMINCEGVRKIVKKYEKCVSVRSVQRLVIIHITYENDF